MIGKTKYKNYVGPRALFDPYFIPPTLLHRIKEQRSLSSILNDSIHDEFSLNILYQGIQGIGKKVIVNKVIEDLSTSNEIQTIRVDCKEKYPEELIGSLIIEMSKFNNLNLNLNPILNSESLPHLWNIFKLSCKKLDNYLLLIFNNAEYLDSDLFKKFLHLKETNTTIISTVNKILRSSTLDITQLFDQKKKLNYFTYHELFAILKQRTTLTFSHEIDKELIEYITDLIFEHYAPVPGKGIEIIRELYPALKDKKNVKYTDMIEVCRNQFDTSESIDEFSLLTYISEEDLLTVIFLDNLSNHFINKSNYYITSNKLKELYDLSCEYLEYRKDLQEFKELLGTMQKLGIVCPSKKSLIENRFNTNDPFSCVYYFMVVDPIQLKAMIDTIFGQF